MDGLHIIIDSDAASDSWGFVGVVRVGEVEAYRTLQAYPTPHDAVRAAQDLVADFLGGVLAGREWQHVRDDHGHLPLREDFNFSVLGDRFRRSRSDDRAEGGA